MLAAHSLLDNYYFSIPFLRSSGNSLSLTHTAHSHIYSILSFLSTYKQQPSEPPSYYANLYRKHNLTGAHVIKLGPGNDDAAKECLRTWPGNCFFLVFLLSLSIKKTLNSLADIRTRKER